MNKLKINVIKDFIYTFLTYLFSLLISLFMVLILPKYIDLYDYGMWQLYLFYTNFVHYLPFGWLEGLYLRYVGITYSKISRIVFKSQFVAFCFFSFFINFIIFCSCKIIGTNSSFEKILYYVIVSSFIILITDFFKFVLRLADRIADFSKIFFVERISLFILLCILLILDRKEFYYFLFADILSKIISMMLCLYSCKLLLIGNIDIIHNIKKEIIENINVGYKILLANASAMFTIAIIRYLISITWGVVVFGKVSLILSISMFLAVFMNAVSTVLVPLLKKIDDSQIPVFYRISNDTFFIIGLIILISYWPLSIIVEIWLPKYSDSVKYIVYLMPSLISSCIVEMLIYPIIKTIRAEKTMLIANGIVFILIAPMAFMFNFYKNLDMLVLTITISYILRQIIFEIWIKEKLKISSIKNMFIQLCMTILFVFTNLYFGNISLVILLISICIVVKFKYYEFKESFIELKKLKMI